MKMTQKKAINLIFNIGLNLIKDLANEEINTKTLCEYGEMLLNRHPQLLEFIKNNKKEEM